MEDRREKNIVHVAHSMYRHHVYPSIRAGSTPIHARLGALLYNILENQKGKEGRERLVFPFLVRSSTVVVVVHIIRTYVVLLFTPLLGSIQEDDCYCRRRRRRRRCFCCCSCSAEKGRRRRKEGRKEGKAGWLGGWV